MAVQLKRVKMVKVESFKGAFLDQFAQSWQSKELTHLNFYCNKVTSS